MREILFICCFIIGILNVHSDATTDAKSTASGVEPTSAATLSEPTSLASTLASVPTTDEKATKDKRQIGAKDEAVYANHRSDTVDADDPENPQETIYGPKPTQFIIRPIAPHEHQQHEDHQPPQLRNYPATIRPHSQQLLEQSQEIQHFAYLQDINRNQPKSSAVASELTGKPHSTHQSKKGTKSGRATALPSQYRGNAEEAEQRYAVAIQPPNPTAAQAPHYGAPPQQIVPRYHIAVQQQQHLGQQGGAPQQPYQIIPEEEFLKLLEEELRARAYHESQYRQQQTIPTPLPTKPLPLPHPTERISQGLGNYRQQAQLQHQSIAEEPTPEYVQYVPRHRGGPKYLPQPQQQPQLQQTEPQVAEAPAEAPPAPSHLPPQLGYYQQQVSYKTLPNHPLAKSSLENEIEKLLAANKPSVGQLTDNSNEPSAVVHQHRQPPQQQLQPHPIPRPRPYAVQQKIYSSPSSSPTPTPLVDANNQPFIPSLFRFSNLQQPTPIYPTQIPQHIVDSKKLGPVIYPPTQAPTPAQQPLPTQYFYQELTPTVRPKSHRSKQYGSKVSTSSPKLREKEPPNYPNVPAAAKYLNPHLYYDYDRHPSGQNSPAQFQPSPLDPNTPAGEQQPQLQHHPQAHAQRYSVPSQPPPPQPSPQAHVTRQYISPSPTPSQSSIYVTQGTGIATPSRSTAVKPKSIEDVRQLHLPQPGGKPLTQNEFQALIDAGYPVTAVPVPIPVPYEQYIKEHPEFRNQPVDYAQLMQRIAQQYGPRRGLQAQHSEPSANVVSLMADAQTATGIGGGNITYLRPVPEQKRHPRDDKETAVAGKTDEAKQ